MRTLLTKQKAISIFFRWCDAKCFKTKWILAISKFLRQKNIWRCHWMVFQFHHLMFICWDYNHKQQLHPEVGDVVASLWEFSPFGFVSVLLDLELNRMPQITNPPNGTPVAFLWELNADSTKLCLIGLRVSSVNGIKILTSHFYILPY